MTEHEKLVLSAVKDRAHSWGESIETITNDTDILGFIVRDCNGNIDNIYLDLIELAMKYSINILE